ncbi:fatty acid desaturase [Corallococcus sp. CA053C]|uniref:fatty acid desaturase family protein n=1 Tax=Corallococcus sp. CA053C TaxID=2316732 RepID=UPI000EA0302C|nr:fatty acid desaturase [Corallococcus sp. CA053C]RKH14552.1 fatty acid desaturase [Corallococcus sp. CA053C]
MNDSPSPVVAFPADDPKRLRSELRRVLPPEAFERQPLRGIIALGLVPVMAALIYALGTQPLPVWACLLIALVLGQLITAVGLAAHEALHHSVFHSRAMENLIGWVGFAPFLVTPGNWRAWHVQAHHSAANVLVRDPDVLPRRTDWHTQVFAKLFHAISPGSGSWLSFISFSVFFTAQGQAFLWHHCRLPAFQHVHFHRMRERVLTLLVAAGWGALGWVLGPRAAFYALVLPLFIGNISLMIYIATNHWLLPASEETDNPFVNTASVETHPLLNWLHFNFSYHQEHHIFPAQSPRYAPLLRKHLRELNPRASIVFPHGHALRMLFRRPALYSADGQTLMGRDGTPVMTTRELRQQLEAPAP